MELTAKTEQRVSSKLLGTVLFIFTEIMFFSGLISAFLLAKVNQGAWPPVGQDRLPLEFTLINTVFLLLSGIILAVGKYKKNLTKYLTFSMIFGLGFFILQGMEWFRLIKVGLYANESIYAAYFYLIIGAHAIHVLMGLAALLYAYIYFKRHNGIEKDRILSIHIFWQFVVFLWPILYYIVYID